VRTGVVAAVLPRPSADIIRLLTLNYWGDLQVEFKSGQPGSFTEIYLMGLPNGVPRQLGIIIATVNSLTFGLFIQGFGKSKSHLLLTNRLSTLMLKDR